MGLLSALGGLFQSDEDRATGTLNGLQRFGNALNQENNQQTTPSAIREYQYYTQLTPEQQQEYLRVKRQEQWLNAGGQFVNPAGAAPIVKTLAPENLPEVRGAQAAESAKGTAVGGATGTAEISLPDQIASAELTLKNIDELIGNKEKGIPEHPGLSQAVGPISSKLPTISDTTADFESRLDQIKSGAFLQSVKQLQGMGALSNIEGEKATDAQTRMKTATSEEGFRKAAEEYRTVVQKGIQRITNKAGGDFSAQGGLNSPQGGPVPLSSDKGMSEMPPASQHAGRTITDTTTGKKYKSNGKEWVPY